jgi:Tyrosine-protein kinase ephrin type A/B receptor-like
MKHLRITMTTTRIPVIAIAIISEIVVITITGIRADNNNNNGTNSCPFYLGIDSATNASVPSCPTQCAQLSSSSFCPTTQTSPVPCPANTHTPGASTGAAHVWDCACDAGRFGFPSCPLCPLNSYCPANATAAVPCPPSLMGVDPLLQFTTSQVGSTSFADCRCPYFATQVLTQCVRCPPSRYIDIGKNNTCLPCPAGNYCPGNGGYNPCGPWSACPAGSAGVGLTCAANNSFYEPNVASAQSVLGGATAASVQGGLSAVSNGTTVVITNITASSSSGSARVHGNGTAACVDGGVLVSYRWAFSAVTDLLVVVQSGKTAVWVADRGCGSIRVISISSGNTSLATVLSGIGARSMALLPTGLVVATDDHSSPGSLWEINPVTLAARVVMTRFASPPLSLAVLPVKPSDLLSIVVVVGTAAYNISFVSGTNWTLMDSVLTPTVPARVAYAGSVLLYADGTDEEVFQMTAGGDWVGLMSGAGVDFLGQRMFTNVTAATLAPGVPITSLQWNNSVLVVGQADRVSAVAVCNPCPPNSSVPLSSQGQLGLSRCKCVAGTYMNQGCAPCVAGAYCPFGTAIPVACPEGSWCGPGVSAPTRCDASVYCSAQSYDAFGHNTLPGGSAETMCSIGYYKTSTSCASCPNGSSTYAIGAVSIADCACVFVMSQDGSQTLFTYLNVTSGACVVCPAAFYCPFASLAPVPCPPGTYCHTGVLSPQTCPSGFYCPGGLPDPVSCEAGTYCPAGSGSKGTCASGSYCPLETTNQIPCPPGSYCPTASGAPTQCPAGSYCVANVSTPAVCQGGYYCPVGASGMTPCPYGTDVVGAVSTSASHAAAPTDCYCVTNYYLSNATQMCVACPLLAFSPPHSTNFSDCTCDTGYKLNRPNNTACVACGAGEYCPAGGTAACPAGYVCSSRSAAPCPAGKYCPINTVVPFDCPLGGVCPSGSTWFVNCSAGTFCPGNASSPTACPPGYYCPIATGAPIPCRGGYQCATGSPLDSVPCSAGLFCPPMTGANGQPCPNGSFCASGASAPTPCPSGYFCPAGVAGGTLCPHAAFCPGATANYTQCPAGYVCARTGMSAPSPCQTNAYYCPAGSFEMQPCAVAYAITAQNMSASAADCDCDIGWTLVSPSAACVPCGAGTYKAARGGQACAVCANNGTVDAARAVCTPAPNITVNATVADTPAAGLDIVVVIGAAAGGVVVVGAIGGIVAFFSLTPSAGGGAAATMMTTAVASEASHGTTAERTPFLFNHTLAMMRPEWERHHQRVGNSSSSASSSPLASFFEQIPLVIGGGASSSSRPISPGKKAMDKLL